MVRVFIVWGKSEGDNLTTDSIYGDLLRSQGGRSTTWLVFQISIVSNWSSEVAKKSQSGVEILPVK